MSKTTSTLVLFLNDSQYWFFLMYLKLTISTILLAIPGICRENKVKFLKILRRAREKNRGHPNFPNFCSRLRKNWGVTPIFGLRLCQNLFIRNYISEERL
jgi:hypothetical protein